MVYLKVTDGYETRKFQIAGEVTFEQLKQQLAALFPSVRDSTDFALKYRDTDGDLITLSTDEELQAALTHLPADAVWRLHIRDSSSLFDRLFEPAWRPFGLFSWEDQAEKLIRERRKKQALQEQKRKAEEEKKRTSNSDEEVKSKNGGHVVEHQPHWHINVFGSWEPRVYSNPFGCRSVIGPVGYHAYWVSSEPERETPKQSQETGGTNSEAPQTPQDTATAEWTEHWHPIQKLPPHCCIS